MLNNGTTFDGLRLVIPYHEVENVSMMLVYIIQM